MFTQGKFEKKFTQPIIIIVKFNGKKTVSFTQSIVRCDQTPSFQIYSQTCGQMPVDGKLLFTFSGWFVLINHFRVRITDKQKEVNDFISLICLFILIHTHASTDTFLQCFFFK